MNAPVPLTAPGAVAPILGCSLAAHEALGWCGRCPGLDLAIEATGWQARHLGVPWTYDYARAVAGPR